MDGRTSTKTQKIAKKATMVEVAKMSGVALSTVSHVINGTASISDETKTRVLEVIQELNYTPNALARGLRQRRSNIIGIIVPDISNEFYAKSASAIVESAGEDGIVPILVDTGYSIQRERKSVETLIQSRADGLIFIGGGKDEKLIDLAVKANTTVVLGDRRYKNYNSVEFNNYDMMYYIIENLYESGYRKIGYISESLDMINLQDRYEGVMAGLKEFGIAINEEWILKDCFLKLDKVDGAKIFMQKIIANMDGDDMPEVFLASSDMIAAGIMDALMTNGFSVPEDIGVIGYDDITLARYYYPAITTVHQDCVELGKNCYELLKKSIGSETEAHVVLKNKYIQRNSVNVHKSKAVNL